MFAGKSSLSRLDGMAASYADPSSCMLMGDHQYYTRGRERLALRDCVCLWALVSNWTEIYRNNVNKVSARESWPARKRQSILKLTLCAQGLFIYSSSLMAIRPTLPPILSMGGDLFACSQALCLPSAAVGSCHFTLCVVCLRLLHLLCVIFLANDALNINNNHS